MRTIKLTYHSGSANHGCEAIVRSICKVFKADKPMIELYSFHSWEDYEFNLDKIVKIFEYNELQYRPLPIRFVERRMRKLFGKDDLIINRRLLENKLDDFMFSIGGDMYSEYNFSMKIAELHCKVKATGHKTVLYGCSIEPDLLDHKDIVDDLKSYHKILARESITYEALLSKGFENTVLIPDPAFQLDKEVRELPVEVSLKDKLIGINISPVVLKGSKGRIVLDNYISLIQYLLKQDNIKIMLVPHVTTDYSDDREAIKVLYNEFKENPRVFKCPEGNCMELKGYIGCCNLFVCARTHASIAAYSLCVPTLVVGYSVKSRGIATDLFGTTEHYVISKQDINGTDDLLKEFMWIEAHEDEIREHLNELMPGYIEKVLEAPQIIFSK